MTYGQLKTLLTTVFGSNWAIGKFGQGVAIADGSVTLTFVDATTTVADNVIYRRSERWQLSYFAADPEADIDDFFIDNGLIYSLKTKINNEEDGFWQTTYTFYL